VRRRSRIYDDERLERREEEQPEPEDLIEPEPREDHPTDREQALAGEVLRLQGLVGNRAVTALISRAELQRDDVAGTKVEEAKGGEEAAGADYTMKMSGIGSFEILSLSWAGPAPTNVGRGDQGKEKTAPPEFTVSKKTDEHSTELLRRSAAGIRIDKVELLLKKHGKTFAKITFDNVVITSYSTGGPSGDKDPIETFSMNAQSMTFEQVTESSDSP
jgi:type VI protein secretion system component Hcp